MKVCVVVASRANFGRLKSVLRAIEAHSNLELQLIVAASVLLERYGDLSLIEGEFPVSETLYTVVEGDEPRTMATTTGLFMTQIANSFARLVPDVVLVHADRYEMLAAATAAAYMNIPVAHTEGGEVTGSIDDKVRRAITQIADLHFPVTEQAKATLIKQGANPEHIYVVGSPALDYLTGLNGRPDFTARYGGVGPEINFDLPYLVVLQHPVTTEYGNGAEQIRSTLDAIRTVRMQTVWLWPNVDAGSDAISKELRRFRELEQPDYVHFFKNLSPEDYGLLIRDSACLIGNTSSGIKEGAFLGVPYVCIGTRQQNREHGYNVRFVGHDAGEIAAAIHAGAGRKHKADYRFGDGHAGERIATILGEVLREGTGNHPRTGRLEAHTA